MRYSPGAPPIEDDPVAFQEYMLEELRNAASVINLLVEGSFEVQHVEPNKRSTGDVRYADGTNWNPGAGEGLYEYLSTNVWSKL